MMHTQTILVDHQSSLGQGTYGRVVRGNVGCEDVAVKLMSQASVSTYTREVEHLMRLWPHPHVCRILGTCAVDSDLGIITELLGDDIFTILQREGSFSEARIRHIFYGPGQALAWMHSIGVVHCDIKLENIMLCKNGTPKIIDFGLANRQCIGSISYTAPEIFGETIRSTPKRDVWAFAVCIFACWAKCFPYDEANSKDSRFVRISQTNETSACAFLLDLYKRQMPSAAMLALLDACFCIDVDQRLPMKDVVANEWWFLPILPTTQVQK